MGGLLGRLPRGDRDEDLPWGRRHGALILVLAGAGPLLLLVGLLARTPVGLLAVAVAVEYVMMSTVSVAFSCLAPIRWELTSSRVVFVFVFVVVSTSSTTGSSRSTISAAMRSGWNSRSLTAATPGALPRTSGLELLPLLPLLPRAKMSLRSCS